MKPYIILFLSVVAVSSASYAQPSGSVAIDDPEFDAVFAKRSLPVVTGKLLNATPEELKQTTITYSLVTFSGQQKHAATLSADGTFRLELEYPLPYQQIWLSVGDLFYAGIYANTDLLVEIDIRKIKASGQELNFNGEGVRYLGTDGPMNAYMNDYILFRREEQLALDSRMHQVSKIGKPVEAEVITVYGGIFDTLKMIQDDYTGTHPSPYAWLLENERLSKYYSMLSLRYWNYAMESGLFNKIKEHKIRAVSNNSTHLYNYLATYITALPANNANISFKEIKNLPNLTNEDKAIIDSMTAAARNSTNPPYTKESVARWSKYLSRRTLDIRRERTRINVLHYIDSVFMPAKADLIKLQLNTSKDIDEQKTALEQILPIMQTAWCKQIAQTTYEHTLNKIAAVNKALAGSGNAATAVGFGEPILLTEFGASLYKITKMSGTDFLSRLRQSFPGKAIVFDLWATWCAPCLGQMPHSKKLQQDAKDLPVVFVYVCTTSGSNEDKWKRKVAEMNQPGIHFFIDETLDAELSQYFSFSGYPGYAFFDKQGVYQPGAFKWLSEIKDKAALAALIK